MVEIDAPTNLVVLILGDYGIRGYGRREISGRIEADDSLAERAELGGRNLIVGIRNSTLGGVDELKRQRGEVAALLRLSGDGRRLRESLPVPEAFVISEEKELVLANRPTDRSPELILL